MYYKHIYINVAILLINEIRVLAFDEKIDVTVWKVEKDKYHIHGLKYSFNYRVWGSGKYPLRSSASRCTCLLENLRFPADG